MPHQKTSLFSQQFRDIRGKINRKIFRKFDAPWMKSKEYDIILEVIYNLKPTTCLEWGSGYSTLIIPELIPNLKLWCSVEHDKDWYMELSKKIVDPTVSISLVEPDNPEFAKGETKLTEKKDGLFQDFERYVEYPGTLDTKFDYIFIDGRARRSCLIKSFELLSENGVVVVHDANRDIYFNDIPNFSDSIRIVDYRKKRKLGGIWIGRKSGKVSDVLDVEHHLSIWKRNDRLAKSLFLK